MASSKRKLVLDKILSANRRQLRAGKTISRAQLITMLGITDISKNPKKTGTYVDLHKENLRLVAAQREVNELLCLNGLYLKAKDYYSYFEVCSKDDTKQTIVRYASQVDVNRACEHRLDAGLHARVQKRTWGYYNRVYTNQGALKQNIRVTPTLGRKEAAVRRVKNY